MFPHIDGEERGHAVHDRRVGIVQARHLELAVVEDEPSPTAGKMARAFFLQLFKQLVGRSEVALDHALQLVGRLGRAFGREALPEEAVIPDLRRIVEEALFALLVRMLDDARQALVGDVVLVLADHRVGLVDIGLVVLAVVIVERLGGHVVAERVLGEGKIGKLESHASLLLAWKKVGFGAPTRLEPDLSTKNAAVPDKSERRRMFVIRSGFIARERGSARAPS